MRARADHLPVGLPFGWGVVALLAGAVVVASALLPVGTIEAGPPLCPFRAATGLPCAGCGLARSFVATAHAEPRAAFELHLFGPVLFVLCALVALAGLFRLIAGRWPRLPIPGRRLVLGAKVGTVALVLWAAWRFVAAL